MQFFRRFFRRQRGASAIEFTIIASIMLPVTLIATDIGLAVHQRMVMDNVLRMASASAMIPGATHDDILSALNTAAATYATGRMQQMTVNVAGPSCFCVGGANICGSPCADGLQRASYTLDAHLVYKSIFVGAAGAIFPDGLQSTLRVETLVEAL